MDLMIKKEGKKKTFARDLEHMGEGPEPEFSLLQQSLFLTGKQRQKKKKKFLKLLQIA